MASERLRFGARAAQLLGLALFLFIPLVLYLFVRRPEPAGVSVAVGVAVMLAHRFVARPYMAWVRPWKCLWTNAALEDGPGASRVRLAVRGAVLEARCHPEHRASARRFFGALARLAVPLRLAIFVPLLALLASVALEAVGYRSPTATLTAVFQLVVGAAVASVAFAYRWFPEAEEPLPVPFPVHNFFLLGVRALLWIFRIVGVAWVMIGMWGVLSGR